MITRHNNNPHTHIHTYEHDQSLVSQTSADIEKHVTRIGDPSAIDSDDLELGWDIYICSMIYVTSNNNIVLTLGFGFKASQQQIWRGGPRQSGQISNADRPVG